MTKQENLETSVTEIKRVTTSDGLAQEEIVALAVIAEGAETPDDAYAANRIKQDMDTSGYNKLAAALAIKSLSTQGYLDRAELYDHECQSHYVGYSLTKKGWDWVIANKSKFILKRPAPAKRGAFDEEIPF